jgi:hypothetical protein
MHTKNTFPDCDSTQGVNSLQNRNSNVQSAIRSIDSAAVNLPALEGNTGTDYILLLTCRR